MCLVILRSGFCVEYRNLTKPYFHGLTIRALLCWNRFGLLIVIAEILLSIPRHNIHCGLHVGVMVRRSNLVNVWSYVVVGD